MGFNKDIQPYTYHINMCQCNGQSVFNVGEELEFPERLTSDCFHGDALLYGRLKSVGKVIPQFFD